MRHPFMADHARRSSANDMDEHDIAYERALAEGRAKAPRAIGDYLADWLAAFAPKPARTFPEGPWGDYERDKAEWKRRNPGATPAEYERAINELLNRRGL